jgi:hypothetical protein
MSLSSLEERQILAHLKNRNNPHALTSTHIGIKTSDSITEGTVNKFALPYTLPEDLKQDLRNAGYSIPDNTTNMSTTQVFDLIFNLLVARR